MTDPVQNQSILGLSMPIMETPRYRLRLMDERDEALFCHLYTDPDVMRRILAPLTPEVARQSFGRVCGHNRKPEPGHRYWAIEDKATAQDIGMAALVRKGDDAELGVMLRHGWWNAGVSSETFVAVLEHAFTTMGLGLVHAERPDDDHALIIDKLLYRFGFERTPERASAPTHCRWELPRPRWMQTRVI